MNRKEEPKVLKQLKELLLNTGAWADVRLSDIDTCYPCFFYCAIGRKVLKVEVATDDETSPLVGIYICEVLFGTHLDNEMRVERVYYGKTPITNEGETDIAFFKTILDNSYYKLK